MRITKENLTRYDKHLKSWHRSKLAPKTALELWRQTEEAGAVAFWPVGGSLLTGKVKFSFKETPPTSGDKGPSNPSTIAGVSSIALTRCGANWFSTPYYRDTAGQNNVGTVAWEPNADGTVRLIINNPSTGAFYYMDQFSSNTVNSTYKRQLPVGKYRVSLKLISGTVPSGAYVYMSHYSGFLGDTATIINTQYNQEEMFTVSDSSMRHLFIFKIVGSFTADIVVRPVLTVLSDSDDAIEQYNGADYTVDLGGTYYGGEIDLATGLMTVTHHCEELTFVSAAESYAGESYVSMRSWPNGYDVDHIGIHGVLRPKTSSGLVCDSLLYKDSSYQSNCVWYGSYSSSNQTEYIWLRFDKDLVGITESSLDGYAVRSKVNNYLAEHPVEIIYELYNPYTVQLSPLQLTTLAQNNRFTPRLNTVYTDADSIQISYQKSPIRIATEQEQAILSLGGNI